MPILVLDFDGVMHSYTSGWQGPEVIPDPPVPGLEIFLGLALRHFEVHVHSSRSSTPGGRAAMQHWCRTWLAPDIARCLFFPEHKPPAMVTLDDRAITFDGVWPEVRRLLAFQPWTRQTPPQARPTDAGTEEEAPSWRPQS